MSDLPAWVWDTVIALQKHRDEHPQYLAEYYPDYEPRRADRCGCEPLEHIPDDIKVTAEAIAEDRNRRPFADPHAALTTARHDFTSVPSSGDVAGEAS